MMDKTYFFKSSSPAARMLADILKKNHWLEQENCLMNDSLLEIPTEISNTLEYKHELAAFLQKYQLNFAPTTFYIDDENYLQVLNDLPEGLWILKPSMLNNGQHIHLFHDQSSILKHYQSSQRMGGPHVLQTYIHPPHLLKGPQFGHKYSLRIFVLMTLPYGVYLYPHGYFNICLSHYDIHKTESLEGHLSNEHLIEGQRNVIQIPSFQYPIFQTFFPKIKNMLADFFQSFRLELENLNLQKLAFLGIDFMLDANENLYLLEMNHGPCFPISADHPLQEKLYMPFWQACYDEILPKIFNLTKKPVIQFQQLC
jgi:Tubulin-tyrosine ligase family